MREEFETWYEEMTSYPVEFGEDGNPSPIGGPLSHNVTLGMWVAWQASRAALCVEIPTDGEASSFGNYVVFDTDDVRAMLDAAGVRYK